MHACMQAQGSPTSNVAVMQNGSLSSSNYYSIPTCVNATIQWAGKVSVVIMTRQNTPVPGVQVSAGSRPRSQKGCTLRLMGILHQ